MAGSTMLFACTKCHSRHKFDDLSNEEQLCKDCRRKYPLVNCNYCQLEFHILKKVEGETVCGKCSHNLQTYGKPNSCRYCHVKAAFKDKCCSRCVSSEKKYGRPIKCQGCNLVCAFIKAQESQAKVNGKILCLQCTLKFKKDRHNLQKQHRREQKYPQTSKHSNFNDAVDFSPHVKKPVIAPLKAENITKSLYKSRIESMDQTSRHSIRPASPFSSEKHDNNNTSLEPTFGDHMTEITSLREKIIKLNKTIAQKEKIILERDKKISEFHAEQWEKDKLLKSKVQSVQKEYEERLENIQEENQSLRKQIKDLTKIKKTPKVDKVSSRIRLEAHKISLTPTSNRSPEQTPSKSPEHTPSKSPQREDVRMDTGNPQEVSDELNVDFDNVANDTADDGDRGEMAEATGNESDTAESKQKSFDEVQAAEIKRLLRQEEGEASSGTDGQSMAKREKKRKRKRKSKLSVEDDDEYPSSTGFDELNPADSGPPTRKRKSKVRKSKVLVSDHEDDDDDDDESATAVRENEVRENEVREEVPIEQIDESNDEEELQIEQRDESNDEEELTIEQRDESNDEEEVPIEQRDESNDEEELQIEQRDESNDEEELTIEQRDESNDEEELQIEQRDESNDEEELTIEQRDESNDEEEEEKPMSEDEYVSNEGDARVVNPAEDSDSDDEQNNVNSDDSSDDNE